MKLETWFTLAGITLAATLGACSESNEDPPESGGSQGGASAGGSSSGGNNSGGSGNNSGGSSNNSGGSGNNSGGSGNNSGGSGNGGSGNGNHPGVGFSGDCAGFTIGDPIPIVVNEIAKQGDDFVELYNVGGGAFDLAGYILTDSDAGCPKPVEDDGEHFVFPSLSVAAGELLLMSKNEDVPSQDPQTDCAGGFASCYWFQFGISGDNGDDIFILAPDGTTIVAHGVIPSGDNYPEGESTGRIPDGTGAWTDCLATPGAPNQAK